MAPKTELCAALCDDVAESVHPSFDLISKHGQEVKSTADAMLARLDELGAMLGTLRVEGREQREALEPVLEAFAAGLARDFAYIDSVEDTVGAIKNAVSQMETQLGQLEQTHFRQARLAEVAAARKGIENLFGKLGGVTASIGQAAGGLTQPIVGGFAGMRGASGAEGGRGVGHRRDGEGRDGGKEYWEDADEIGGGGGEGMVGKLSENVSKVTEGLKQKLSMGGKKAEEGGDGRMPPPKGKIPSA